MVISSDNLLPGSIALIGVASGSYAALLAGRSVFGSDTLSQRYNTFQKMLSDSSLSLLDRIYSAKEIAFGSATWTQRASNFIKACFYSAISYSAYSAFHSFNHSTTSSSDPDYVPTPQSKLAFKRLTKEFKQCPAAKSFLDDLKRKYSIQFRWSTRIPKAAIESNHDSYPFFIKPKITILINPKISPGEKVMGLLFELANSCHLNKFKLISDFASQGKLSKEQYAQLIEKVEDRTAKLHHRIASRCVQKGIWPSEIDAFANVKYNHFFHGYAQEISGHTQMYRNQWQSTYKRNFCYKQPLHPDCSKQNDSYSASNSFFNTINRQAVLDSIPMSIKNIIRQIPTCLD